jgi:hypothetical protein
MQLSPAARDISTSTIDQIRIRRQTMAKRTTKQSPSSITVESLGKFGEFGRYRLERWTSKRPLLAEIGASVTYAVFDAETPDETTGFATIIRQEYMLESAVAGLCDSDELAKLADAS